MTEHLDYKSLEHNNNFAINGGDDDNHDNEANHDHNHDHAHNHAHDHSHKHGNDPNHKHEHGKKGSHDHNHDHQHGHKHDHKHDHDHDHKGHDHDHKGHDHDHKGHNHGDEDADGNKSTLKKLYIATGVSLFFIAAQLYGGYVANSIAIMLDTAHLATDVLGFIISIMAIKLGSRNAERKMSFGYHRAEVIGSIISIGFLMAITIWLLFAAYKRLQDPPEIQDTVMLITAIAGLFFNIVQLKILGGHELSHGHSHGHGHNHGHGHGHDHGHDHSHDHGPANQEPLLDGERPKRAKNINLTSAQMHVLGDLLNSIGVIIAALIIYFAGQDYRIADPIVTFIFTIIILNTSYPTLKAGILTLMEATPDEIDHELVENDIKEVQGVEEVHDLHVWALTSGKNACSAHITSEHPFQTLKRVQHMLIKKHGMMHVTIQIEPHSQSPDSRHEDHFDCDNKLHKNIHVK